MYYYKFNNKILLSHIPRTFEDILEKEVEFAEGIVYYLTDLDPSCSRRSFAASAVSDLLVKEENLSLLKKSKVTTEDFPNWLINKIKEREVTCINTSYPAWEQMLLSLPSGSEKTTRKWKVNVVGLGDVGGTLVTGLRLLGGKSISQIGIFDKDPNKIKRWEYETAQILSPNEANVFPEIYALSEKELFDCDMFVFCVSIGVPETIKEGEDVRLLQFKGNASILSYYAKLARMHKFSGIFAVVSDPVDLLCKVAFKESNVDQNNTLDYLGLAPEQIRGYGLGVMNARAVFYAKQQEETLSYLTEGRAFGPHGEGLVIANSIKNYDEGLSSFLTEKTKKANLDVRASGFKPYIAPALSSGALSLLATIEGEWHYSATYIGGTFMGARNRLLTAGVELETYYLTETLFTKLTETYEYLRTFI